MTNPQMHGKRLPLTVREIPDSWWDVVLNGEQWHVTASTFAIPGIELAELRNCAYRRGYPRNVFVASRIDRRLGRLYLQARERNFLPAPAWNITREAPPMHYLDGNLNTDKVLIQVAEAVLAALRANGLQVIIPGSKVQAPVMQPEPVRPLIPAPEEQMLAALDSASSGAGQDEVQLELLSDDEMVAWMVSQCTCGTGGEGVHAPSCRVWG